ncbi:MAG: hypothetical protein H6577_22330 [Lewinellaceae bacterium]|nr:hypothetical protein [Lewinellaceae bacterium]
MQIAGQRNCPAIFFCPEKLATNPGFFSFERNFFMKTVETLNLAKVSDVSQTFIPN